MNYLVQPLSPANLEATLGKYCKKGDIILNLSVEVDSLEVVKWGQKHGVMYLDTCIEPWANYYDNTDIFTIQVNTPSTPLGAGPSTSLGTSRAPARPMSRPQRPASGRRVYPSLARRSV